MKQNTRLNRANFPSVVDWAGRFPGAAQIASALEMHAPAIGFRAAGAKQIAIAQLHRLIFYWTENAWRQALRFRPTLAGIIGLHQHAPPGAGTGPYFVEQEQRSRLRLK